MSQADPKSTARQEFDPSIHGLLPDANIQTKIEFARICIQLYCQENWKAATLSEYYGADFAPFVQEKFAAIDDTNRRRLCNLLRN